MVDKVEYKDVCEPYTERVCVTQPEEECKTVPFRNCTGVIETKQDRRCFDVTELETTVWQDKIVTIMDVTCKDTFDFDCKKKKAAELGMEGYGMFTSCEMIPRRRCYETPRQKVTNEHPEPEQ